MIRTITKKNIQNLFYHNKVLLKTILKFKQMKKIQTKLISIVSKEEYFNTI
jgi:hypothetical protein